MVKVFTYVESGDKVLCILQDKSFFTLDIKTSDGFEHANLEMDRIGRLFLDTDEGDPDNEEAICRALEKAIDFELKARLEQELFVFL
jgi:hypothetical protein